MTMRAVVQRVTRARVTAGAEETGAIGKGLLALVAAGEGDDETHADYIADKIAQLRVFEDAAGKMNVPVLDAGGAVLVVSQFTLYGDCRKGRRPSFAHALEPQRAEQLVTRVCERLRAAGLTVATGKFRAEMQVELVNDGPVTLLLDSLKQF